MAFASDTTEFSPMRLEPEAMFRAPVGFVSPLWAVFAGAALSGVAWWWATQWMRSPAIFLETVTEAVEAGEAVSPKLLEPVAAAVAGSAVVEAELPAVLIGGESAPVPPAALEGAVLAEPAEIPPEPATFAVEPPVVEGSAEPEAASKPKPAAPKARPSAPSA